MFLVAVICQDRHFSRKIIAECYGRDYQSIYNSEMVSKSTLLWRLQEYTESQDRFQPSTETGRIKVTTYTDYFDMFCVKIF